jgi:GDPmannose 4,6-dehydratase
LQSKLYLGNLDSKRDWGYAPEYVEAMWAMLQQDKPVNLVIGTGEAHTVREFVEEAFGYVGLDYQEYVEIDSRYFRPNEVDSLEADSRNAQKLLNWNPKVRYHDLVRIMMDADLELVRLEAPGEGKKIVKDQFDDWHKWEDQVVSMGR